MDLADIDMSKPLAQRKLNMMATEMVTTGTMVEIIPVPIPLIITVAGPVCEASAIFCVGL
jgi:hypothetical protein